MKAAFFHRLRTSTILLLLLPGVGCRTYQKVTYLPPGRLAELINYNNTVVTGTVVDSSWEAEPTLEEELSIGGMVPPANGYRSDITILIDYVVKGYYSGVTLKLENLKDERNNGKFIESGMVRNCRLHVGWQSESGGKFRHLQILKSYPSTLP